MTLNVKCKCDCASKIERGELQLELGSVAQEFRRQRDTIQYLEQQVQRLYLEHELKIAALLEHFERQQKHALEFVPVEAVAAKVEVRRRG